MDNKIEKLLDATGLKILEELQNNARISYTELGQRVGLTSPAVTDRIQRMEAAGIITGYHAKINLGKVGLPIMAIVRLGEIGGWSCADKAEQIKTMSEVVELHRTTGDDSMVVKVVASSMEHLTNVLDQLSRFGIPSTSIVRTKPFIRTTVPPDLFD